MQDLITQKETPFAKNDPKNPVQSIENSKSQNISIAEEKNPSNDVIMNEIKIDIAENVPNNKSENIIAETSIPVNDEIEYINKDSRKMTAQHSEFKCAYCTITFKQKTKLITHMNNHENNFVISEFLNYFTCLKCNTMFLSEELLNQHKKTHDKENEHFIDDCTDYQYLDDQRQPTNLDSKETQIHYKCSICDVTDHQEMNMKRHIISHANKLSCPFENCGSEYSCFSRLNIHIINKHLVNHEFKCLHCCEVSFETFDELQNHIKKECKERKFKCYHCGMEIFVYEFYLLYKLYCFKKNVFLLF